MPTFLLLSLSSAVYIRAASGHQFELSPDTANHGNYEEKQWPRGFMGVLRGTGKQRNMSFRLPFFPGCFCQPIIATAELQVCCWTLSLLFVVMKARAVAG